MTTATGVRRRVGALPAVTAVALLAVLALALLRRAGDDGFPTDPVGSLALAAAAVVAVLVGGGPARRLVLWLLLYLVTAVWAVAAVRAGSGDLAVALWGAAWIPPLGAAQLTVAASVRQRVGNAWDTRFLVGVLTCAVLATVLLSSPTEPFAGFPPLAPDAWRSRFTLVGDVLTVAGLVALLLLPTRLGRAALTSSGPARARLGVAAAGAAAAPVTVVFCLLLAVARDPGAVDPAVGSVAFLVALAGASVFACGCAVVAAREAVAPGSVLVVARSTALLLAVLLVLAGGTLVAAPSSGLGPTAVALVVAVLTVGCVVGAWAAAGRVAGALTPPEPATPAEPVRVQGLTARECEVLGLLAEGASNAGIAAQLVISERTVDAHLRSVFSKLDLRADAGGNRRVQAARIWLTHPR